MTPWRQAVQMAGAAPGPLFAALEAFYASGAEARKVVSAFWGPYILPGPFPAISVFTLPSSLAGWGWAATEAAEKLTPVVESFAAVPKVMGESRAEVFDATRAQRFATIFGAAEAFVSCDQARAKLVDLVNWYIDSWKQVDVSAYDLSSKKEWWTYRAFAVLQMISNRPRLKEAFRDLFAASWLFDATNEIPQKALLNVAPLVLNLSPWKPTMPQYFTILYASLAPLAAGNAPNVLGPFATPDAAMNAAKTMAGVVSQMNGYAFAQPAMFNAATQAWQWLGQGIPVIPGNKLPVGNWGGW